MLVFKTPTFAYKIQKIGRIFSNHLYISIFFRTFAAQIIVRIHIHYPRIRTQKTKRKRNAMPNMQLQTLPIGEQSFEKLRRENRLYVDKTEYVYRMAQDGTHYFLSRPRRFGKSLLLSTIEAYFLGKKELFDGLYISTQESNWGIYPVMHLDFNAQNYDSEQKLNSFLNSFLCRQEDIYGSNPNDVDLGVRFEGVIRRASEQTGKGVVILVDEYDKPLLQAINNPELQDAYRGIMRGFFGALKSMDQYIRFSFLTGLTKFSKLSVFSDLNNLRDISRKESFALICGLTDEEVDRDLSPYIDRFAEKRGTSYEEVRADLQRMYDGYHFVDNTPGLYNPFSVMNALWDMELGSYWFESGTPTMLVEMLRRKQYKLDTLEGTVGVSTLDNRTGRNDNVVALLYQSGYLSIAGASEDKQTYRLEFPNEEVRSGFFQFVLPYYAKVQGDDTASEIGKFLDDVRNGRVEQFLQRLQSLFADFQYDAQKDSYTEEHFRNVLYMLCKLLGLKVKAEYMTSDGRIDLLITTDKYRYVIECKIDSTPAVALKQIHDKQYGLSWILDEKETILIGLNFSTTSRRPDSWIIERQDGTISESGMKSGMKSGMSSESGMPNDKWPKSWPKKWPNHAEMILEAIAHDTTITVLELENQLPIGHSTIAKLLVALQTEGYLDRVKDNTGTHWQILDKK